ncbi:MAG: hypothetical protein AABN33_23235 [Acidobacteriota bacterium]
MANFVHNVASGEAAYSQWKRYLQQQEYTTDITSAIRSQTKSYETEIRKASEAMRSSTDEASRQQAEAITNAATMVVGRLDEGFSELASGLSTLEMSVDRMATMLDWRLSQVIDQQRISNLLLGNIALLLRIPDIQKERQYFIEQGFKHYKNAALDSDLYQDAIDNLLEAEKREKTDYVVLHTIGRIYRHSPDLLDLPKAEAYFRKAAKYAVVESGPNAERAFNVLTNGVGANLAEQSIMPQAAAAESYHQAGITCYAQGKLADAVELSDRALGLMPSLLEAGFVKAKALAAGGAESEAADVLEGVVRAERFYAVKTTTDGDLAPKPKVQALLVKLKDEYGQKARHAIDQLNRAIETAQKVGAHNRLAENINASNTLEQEFKKGGFFNYSGILPKANEWSEQAFKIAEDTVSEKISITESSLRQLDGEMNQEIAKMNQHVYGLKQERQNIKGKSSDRLFGCLYAILFLPCAAIGWSIAHPLMRPSDQFGRGGNMAGPIFLFLGTTFLGPIIIFGLVQILLKFMSVTIPKNQLSRRIDRSEHENEIAKGRVEYEFSSRRNKVNKRLAELQQLLQKCRARQYV